ncbi:7663_t:CDS:1 [Gigaspora margarita]|uniref:7663_t:CDS:1 n=1 Tax=Gigaspora margarita TaxID=4874 RepID=A0ABN7VRY9_GIGMA|nr:7663_t:CDS:1 [Gigaspora margarita]
MYHQNESLNDPVLNTCNDLMKNTYTTSEFKEKMNYVLLYLYERLKNTLHYFLKLVFTDAIIEPIDIHCAHIDQYNQIKDFIIYFAEVIYDYGDLAKMKYILLIEKKISKGAGDVFDQENKFRFKIKELEMCKFIEMFFTPEEFETFNVNFKKFYEDCYSSHGNEELGVYDKIFRCLDPKPSIRN